MARAARPTSRWCLVLALCASLTDIAKAQGGANEEFSLDEPAEGASAPAQPSAAPPSAAETAGAGEAELLSDEQALAEEQAADDRVRGSTDPYEDPKQSYFFVGAAWRYVIMPAFTLEWFLDAAPTLATAGSFLGEFGYRKKGFQVTAQLGWMKWNFKGPFQLNGDPPEDTEWLDAKLNMLMASAAITWSTSFTDWFAIEYGVEAGIAGVIGDITRSEAYHKAGGAWAACPTYYASNAWPYARDPSASGDAALYCDTPVPTASGVIPPTNETDEDGAHYGVKAKHGLVNKGIPRVVPVLGPRVSLRFKPIHQLVIRVDVPLPLFPYGFVGGVAAHFGF